VTDELHPALRADLEIREARAEEHRRNRERRHEAIARDPAAWPMLTLPDPLAAEFAGDVEAWLQAVVEVAMLDGLDAVTFENLKRLREWYVQSFRPDQLERVSPLFELTDELLQRVVDGIRAAREGG
jgi:hypothetical protein